MTDNRYDIIIIGGGPSGLTAGLYAARACMKVLLVEKMGCGGQSVITDWIENFPGFPDGISGFELAVKFEEQARKFGLEIDYQDITGLAVDEVTNEKIVKTADREYRATAVIVSSGAYYKTLDIPGETEFRGKGVSYCATCDGPFFRDKDIIVVGGGNSAVQEAIFLTKFAKSVTLVHRRDRLRAANILQERAKANPKIAYKWNCVVEKINGGEQVQGVTLRNVMTKTTEDLPVQGVFVFVGHAPNSEFLKGVVALDEEGFVITDEDMMTDVPGIFACGDVRRKLLRQVITAAGDGATAAFAAEEYVEDFRGASYK